MINNTYKPVSSSLLSPQKPSFGGLLGGLKAPSSGLVSLATTAVPKKPAAQSNSGNAFSGNNMPQAVIANTMAQRTEPSTANKVASTQNVAYNPPVQTSPQTQFQSQPQNNFGAPANTEPVRGLLPTSLFGSLVTRGQESLAKAAEVGKETGLLKAQMQRDEQGVMGNPNYSRSVKIGQAGLIDQNYGTQLQGLAAEQQALQGLGQSYITAAGVAQPVQVPYSNQFIDPTTGQPVGGGSSNSLNDAVSTIAQRVQAGTMSYDDGVAALSGYGQGGMNALQQALGSNFNPLSSNALAGSRGSIIQDATTDIANMQANLSAADTNLAQLTNLAQQSGINDLSTVTGNKISNLFKKEFSNQALLSYEALLNGTRALYTAVLQSRANISPTDAFNIAKSLVPENISVKALQDLTNTLKTEAQTIVAAKQSQVQNAQNPNEQTNAQPSNNAQAGLFNW